MNFYITFGQKWRRFQHPHSVKGIHPHPDGWVRVVVPPVEDDGAAYDAAFTAAKAAFGGEFSGLYSWENLEEPFYPLGELGVIGEQVTA